MQAILLVATGLALWAQAGHHVLGTELRCRRSDDTCELRRGLLGVTAEPLATLSNPRAHEGSGKNDRDAIQFSLGWTDREIDVESIEVARTEVARIRAFVDGDAAELVVTGHNFPLLIVLSLVFGVIFGAVGVAHWRSAS